MNVDRARMDLLMQGGSESQGIALNELFREIDRLNQVVDYWKCEFARVDADRAIAVRDLDQYSANRLAATEIWAMKAAQDAVKYMGPAERLGLKRKSTYSVVHGLESEDAIQDRHLKAIEDAMRRARVPTNAEIMAKLDLIADQLADPEVLGMARLIADPSTPKDIVQRTLVLLLNCAWHDKLGAYQSVSAAVSEAEKVRAASESVNEPIGPPAAKPAHAPVMVTQEGIREVGALIEERDRLAKSVFVRYTDGRWLDFDFRLTGNLAFAQKFPSAERARTVLLERGLDAMMFAFPPCVTE